MSLYERQNADTAGSGSRFYDPQQTIIRLSSLDKFRRVGQDRYVVCCPAHDDKNPSLSMTQTPDKVLVHCFAGCDQMEVLQVLSDLGLWHKASTGKSLDLTDGYSAEEIDFMANCCFIANSMKRKGQTLIAEDRRVLRGYFEVLRRHQPELAISIAEDARND